MKLMCVKMRTVKRIVGSKDGKVEEKQGTTKKRGTLISGYMG